MKTWFCPLLLLATIATWAAGAIDFSGSYTLKSAKGGDGPDKGEVWTLRVEQTESRITITRVMNGHSLPEAFSFGSPMACRDADGGDARCSAQWKRKTLELETDYATHPTESGPEVEKQTRERLELSSNGKVLTIHSSTKAPEYPALSMGEGTTEVYERD